MEPLIVHYIVEKWKRCLLSWKEHIVARGLQEDPQPAVGLMMKSGHDQICARYNALANQLGGKFAKGDGQCCIHLFDPHNLIGLLY
jgi:hypothetical protein